MTTAETQKALVTNVPKDADKELKDAEAAAKELRAEEMKQKSGAEKKLIEKKGDIIQVENNPRTGMPPRMRLFQHGNIEEPAREAEKQDEHSM